MAAFPHPIEASPTSPTLAAQVPAKAGNWRAAMRRWLGAERRAAGGTPDDPDAHHDLNTQIWFLLPPC